MDMAPAVSSAKPANITYRALGTTPAKLAVKANGTVMPSDVPITASSVVCEDGFRSSLDSRERKLDLTAGQEALSRGLFMEMVCDSTSMLFESMMVFSEEMELESTQEDGGHVSECKC